MRNKLGHLMNSQAAGGAAADDRGTPAGVTRRGFLIGAAGAGFSLAFVRPELVNARPADVMAEGSFEPTIWYHIEADGSIVVNIAEAEMGQHVGTALARIVADELEADWSKVSLNYVDSDPKWGYMVTGGSWSVHQNWKSLSQAGAAGRMVLIEEGAKLLGAKRAECTARDGKVSAGGKSISYGEIVSRADLTRSFTPEQLEEMPVKAPAERRLVGQDTLALDVPAKSRGQGIYGIDAWYEGLVYARPILPPTRYGSSVKKVDDKAAKQVPGYRQTLVLDDPSDTVPGWVMVIADSFAAANKAANMIDVEWDAGKTANVSEQDILEHGWKVLGDTSRGALVVADEGVDQAFANAASTLEQTYVTHSVLHFQLEPLNCLAYQTADGKWEIHTGNQWQNLALPWLAAALETEESNITLRTYLLGGGFGRRLNGDYTVPAALAAKALGKPVKMIMTREDDARFDSIRSASNQKVRMAFDGDGKVIGMEHHATAGWPTLVMAPFFMPEGANGEKYDQFSISGADHWYSVGAHRVRAVTNDLANDTFRPGWLRSVGPGWTNWALECFMDDAARQVGKDPIDFRLELLKAEGRNAGSAPNSVGGAERMAGVLRKVREMSGWGAELPADTGMGVACTFGQERNMPTWSACVAQVKVDRNSGRVKLEKLWLAVDAGTVVHPDGALAQMEGAALWGASMALHEGTVIENGQVRDRNLGAYTPLRMSDVPEMEIAFVESTEIPVGLGEPATTVVGPAIGNAIHAAVGVRMTEIPIRPEAVKRALQA